MSIVIGGRKIATAFESVSFLDDPNTAPPVTDSSPRVRRIRSIVLHSVHGKLGPVRAGFRPSDRAAVYARYQTRSARKVSWDATLDTDGTLLWQNDPTLRFTWHATSQNPVSIGIELVQDDDGSLYDGQLQTLVKVLDVLTAELRVQRQIPWTATGLPRGVRPRLDEKGPTQGVNVTGVVAHFMNTSSRGAGDVSAPFEYLRRANYEVFDLDAGADLDAWRERQRRVCGFDPHDCDGIPLDKTCAALEAAGYEHGLWVRR